MRITIGLPVALSFVLHGYARSDTLVIGNKSEDAFSFVELETRDEPACVAIDKSPHAKAAVA